MPLASVDMVSGQKHETTNVESRCAFDKFPGRTFDDGIGTTRGWHKTWPFCVWSFICAGISDGHQRCLSGNQSSQATSISTNTRMGNHEDNRTPQISDSHHPNYVWHRQTVDETSKQSYRQVVRQLRQYTSKTVRNDPSKKCLISSLQVLSHCCA